MSHAIGDRFCLADAASIRSIELPASAVAATLWATAHGIGDVAPLPVAQRLISGESLRPLSPCHLRAERQGSDLAVRWVRRSHRGWAWADGVGVAEDPFPERYRLSISGPAGDLVVETATPASNFELSGLPAEPGELVTLTVAAIGPTALSHPISTTITL